MGYPLSPQPATPSSSPACLELAEAMKRRGAISSLQELAAAMERCDAMGPHEELAAAMERRVAALERHLEFSGRLSASPQRNTASCTSSPSSHAEDAAALLQATSPLESSTWAAPLKVPQ